MKRWRTTWAVTAIAGIVAVPSNSYGQDPAERPPASSAAPQRETPGTAQDHLRQADAAVKSISSTAVSSNAAARIAELKQHLNALQAAAAAGPAHAGPSAAASTNAHAGHGGQSGAQWSTHAAAADKIIGELLSDAPAGAIGPTTGTDARPGGGPGTASARGAASLDDDTRAKLTTARAGLMAFAAAMGGTVSGPNEPSRGGAPAPPPAGSETSSATSPAAAAAPTHAPGQPSAAPPSADSTPASGAGKPAAGGGPASAQSASAAQAPSGPAPSTGGSFDTAKHALTAARDSLSQLTKLPAVQQLTGEPRAQVSQLITAFNTLITTTTDWRGAYAKVDALVTALIRPPAAAQPADGGTAGASGVPADGLDPVLKAKLDEFRTHLKEFETAANAVPGK